MLTDRVAVAQISVLNVPQKTIEAALHLTDDQYSLMTSLFAVGGFLGAQVIASPVADTYGRKAYILWSSILFIISGVLMTTAGFLEDQHTAAYALVVVGRVIGGIGAGGGSVVTPMYLSEIAPKSVRGLFGSLTQFAIVIGILLSTSIAIPMSSQWKWLFSIGGILGVVQLLLAPLIRESPAFDVAKSRRDAARTTLCAYQGLDEMSADRAVYEMAVEVSSRSSKTSVSFRTVLSDFRLRRPLLIAVGLQVAQQLSGINAVFFYRCVGHKDSNQIEWS